MYHTKKWATDSIFYCLKMLAHVHRINHVCKCLHPENDLYQKPHNRDTFVHVNVGMHRQLIYYWEKNGLLLCYMFGGLSKHSWQIFLCLSWTITQHSCSNSGSFLYICISPISNIFWNFHDYLQQNPCCLSFSELEHHLSSTVFWTFSL